MASFLINTPNQQVFGSEENDVFLIQTALNTNVQGLEGDDLFTGSANTYIASTIQGGPGNDTLNLSGGSALTTDARFNGGGGHDFISGTKFGTVTDTTINGGDGNDTIFFSASDRIGTGTVVNGNGGEDRIKVDSQSGVFKALVAGGGGNDTIFFSATRSANSVTLAGGGGSDFISGVFDDASSLRVEGDTLTDSEFFGNDTIIINGHDSAQNVFINGGGGADSIKVDISALNIFTIGGGNGRDTIFISADSASGGRVNAGAASDVVNWSGSADRSVSIFGGGGNDTITVGDGYSGVVIGGEGENYYNVADASALIRYEADHVSTVGELDYISASAAANTAFRLSQDILTATVAVGSNSNFTTDGNGKVTFTAGFDTNLTARVNELDSVFTKGSVASFNDGSRTYIFIQGGAIDGGIEDDVVIRTNKTASAFTIAGGTSIAVRY